MSNNIESNILSELNNTIKELKEIVDENNALKEKKKTLFQENIKTLNINNNLKKELSSKEEKLLLLESASYNLIKTLGGIAVSNESKQVVETAINKVKKLLPLKNAFVVIGSPKELSSKQDSKKKEQDSKNNSPKKITNFKIREIPTKVQESTNAVQKNNKPEQVPAIKKEYNKTTVPVCRPIVNLNKNRRK